MYYNDLFWGATDKWEEGYSGTGDLGFSCEKVSTNTVI